MLYSSNTDTFFKSCRNNIWKTIVGFIVLFILAILTLLVIENINPGQKTIVNDDYKIYPDLKRLLESGWDIGDRPIA